MRSAVHREVTYHTGNLKPAGIGLTCLTLPSLSYEQQMVDQVGGKIGIGMIIGDENYYSYSE